MIRPKDYAEQTPKRTVAEFMVAWKKKKWAVAPLQVTWAALYQQPAMEIEARFDSLELTDARIVSVEKITDVTFDVTVAIQYLFNRRYQNREIVARVIRETAPYTPSADGQWGVNPPSLLRGLYPDTN